MQASDLTPFLAPSCEDVLDSMYFTSVLDVERAAAMPFDPADHAFSLQFKGDLCGEFGISCQPATARTLAANFLGEDEESIAPTDTAEVIGELTNMLCGSILSRTGSPNPFALSHPLPASPLTLASANGENYHALLHTDIGPILTWFVFHQPALTARGE